MKLLRHIGFVLVALAIPATVRAQIPETFTNLQVLPQDIARDSLLRVMRGFSFALGVRCQYCHVGGDGIAFEGVRFADDDDEDKRKARYMLRMVAQLNDEMLPGLPNRDMPGVRVQCVTCHGGLARPQTLEAVLSETIARAGTDSAVAHYRRLREDYYGSGAYDFGPQRLMELARGLSQTGMTGEAVRMLELNAEFHPRHAGNYIQLGDVQMLRGARDTAIAAFEKALEIDPRNDQARRRLEQLRGRRLEQEGSPGGAGDPGAVSAILASASRPQ